MLSGCARSGIIYRHKRANSCPEIIPLSKVKFSRDKVTVFNESPEQKNWKTTSPTLQNPPLFILLS